MNNTMLVICAKFVKELNTWYRFIQYQIKWGSFGWCNIMYFRIIILYVRDVRTENCLFRFSHRDLVGCCVYISCVFLYLISCVRFGYYYWTWSSEHCKAIPIYSRNSNKFEFLYKSSIFDTRSVICCLSWLLRACIYFSFTIFQRARIRTLMLF